MPRGANLRLPFCLSTPEKMPSHTSPSSPDHGVFLLLPCRKFPDARSNLICHEAASPHYFSGTKLISTSDTWSKPCTTTILSDPFLRHTPCLPTISSLLAPPLYLPSIPLFSAFLRSLPPALAFFSSSCLSPKLTLIPFPFSRLPPYSTPPVFIIFKTARILRYSP